MHSNNSIKNTWQNINSLICNNNRYVNITELKKNDTHITNPKEISNVFNDFFVNVGFKSKDNILIIPATPLRFSSTAKPQINIYASNY